MEKGSTKAAATQGAAPAPTKKIVTKNIKPSVAVDEKNSSNVKEAVAKKKDLMYRYEPSDMGGEDKKKFRAAARRQRDSFVKQITAAKNQEDADKLREEAKKWAKLTYSKEYLPNVTF